MDKNKATLAIYGIQDRADNPFPVESHDHSLVLMQNGSVCEFIEIERISRNKHEHRLKDYIYPIIKSLGLFNAEKFDLIYSDNVLGRSFISKEGDIRLEAPLNNTLRNTVEKARAYWFGQSPDSYILNHELAHVCSCIPFYGPIMDNSLCIHFDGGASRSNFSAWLFRNNVFHKLEAHWDLKYLSGFFNANALVFGIIGVKQHEHMSVPGKMMGLAAYGEYRQELEEWLVQNHYFQNIWGNKQDFFKKLKSDFDYDIGHLHDKDPFCQDIIATMHEIFIRDFILRIRSLRDQTNAVNLYLTGGSALNISCNTRLLKMGAFEKVMIPPCTSDTGLALGAASYLEYLKHGKVNLHSPFLNSFGLETIDYKNDLIPDLAESIANKQIAGICNGPAECGPRALGNRSIIAHPASKALGEILSMEKKKREWYRPIAPVMRLDQASYFTGLKTFPKTASYMLNQFSILPDKIHEIEAVVHEDHSSRIQILFQREDHPFLWDLLDYLEKNHRIRALINTSFNTRGEPMVHRYEDALKSATKMKLDVLVYNYKLIRL